MKFLLILFALLSTCVTAETPTETANRYFAEVSKGDIYELGKYYHTEAQVEFRSLMSFLNEVDIELQEVLVHQVFGAGRKPHHLRLMSDEKFLSAFLEFVYTTEQSIDKISIGERQALGDVLENKDTAYVVVKTKGDVAGVKTETFDVMPFKRENGIWKALLNTRTKTAANQINTVMNSK